MRDILEEEALQLTSRPLVCEDSPPWSPLKVQPGTVSLGVGVLDEDGVGVQMYVELLYRHSQKTNFTSYKFTLFKRHGYGKDRVYQLDVAQTRKPVQNSHSHSLSHEHMGASRTQGDASWVSWGYDDVLAHFCERTNITFRPLPLHPDHFQLTGD